MYISREDFAKALKSGVEIDTTSVLRKQFVSEVTKADKTSNARQFVVSTAAVDRDNDVISPKGWKLDNYRKNPVVLFAHDYTSLPIGKCVDIKMAGGQLIATAEFADHEMAGTVLRLIDGGFLNATSVGFRPVKYQLNDERRGVDFEEQELLEFSIVPVPANPDALIVSREVMRDVEVLRAGLSKTLAALAGVKSGSPEPPPAGPKPKPAPPSASPLEQTKRPPPFEPKDKPADDGEPVADDDEDDKSKNPKPPPPAIIGDNADEPLDNGPGSRKPNDATPDSDDKPKAIAEMVVRILKGGCNCTSGADHSAEACKCCKGGSCECTACMKAEDVAVQKRGRMLSARNEAKIRAAHGHLDDVLGALPKDDSPDDGGDDVEAAADIETKNVVVIDLDDDDTLADISPEDMREVFASVVRETVRSTFGDIVKTETQSALNRARGRLD